MRLRLPGNDQDTILQYRLGPDLADIALRLEEVVQDDPHHAAYQIVGMADLIESQAARIAELEGVVERLPVTKDGKRVSGPDHYDLVLVYKSAGPDLVTGPATYEELIRCRTGTAPSWWVGVYSSEEAAAEAARKVTNDE